MGILHRRFFSHFSLAVGYVSSGRKMVLELVVKWEKLAFVVTVGVAAWADGGAFW